jgi:hypothetical protein
MDIQGYRQVATGLYLDWFGCGEWWLVQGGMGSGGTSTRARWVGRSRPHNARVRSADAMVLGCAHWPWTVLIGSAPKRRAVGVRHVLGLDYGLGRQRSLRSVLA